MLSPNKRKASKAADPGSDSESGSSDDEAIPYRTLDRLRLAEAAVCLYSSGEEQFKLLFWGPKQEYRRDLPLKDVRQLVDGLPAGLEYSSDSFALLRTAYAAAGYKPGTTRERVYATAEVSQCLPSIHRLLCLHRNAPGSPAQRRDRSGLSRHEVKRASSAHCGMHTAASIF